MEEDLQQLPNGRIRLQIYDLRSADLTNTLASVTGIADSRCGLCPDRRAT
jgi:hypothetical protein